MRSRLQSNFLRSSRHVILELLVLSTIVAPAPFRAYADSTLPQSLSRNLSFGDHTRAALETPASHYIATPLTPAETCNEPFGGALPSNSFLDDLSKSGATPIKYIWDFMHNVLHSEQQQYEYYPSYNPGRVGFAANGRPMIRDASFNLQVLQDDGTWKSINLLDVAKASLAVQGLDWRPAAPGHYADSSQYADPDVSSESRIVFDKSCNAYALLQASRSSLGYSLLLHSYDGGHSWAAYRIPGSDGAMTSAIIETPSNPGGLTQTPAILLNEPYRYSGAPDTLRVVFPIKKSDRTLSFTGPYIVARDTISSPVLGGAENYAVSSEDLIHIVYPGNALVVDRWTGRHGTPAYAITVSRSSGSVVHGPTFLDAGVSQDDATDVDEHNQPVIAIDSAAYVHVVVSGHGGPLYYHKSLRPNDTSAWTGTEILGKRPTASAPHADEYTYPSLIVNQYHEPIVVARWSGEGYVFKLVAMMKDTNSGRWTDQQILVDPGRSYYAHWYHKSSIDPWGRIFINYKYYPASLFADEVTILENTYGFSLSNPVDLDGKSPCTPTKHNKFPVYYCSYSGYHAVNNTILISAGVGRIFQLATTRTFFTFGSSSD